MHVGSKCHRENVRVASLEKVAIVGMERRGGVGGGGGSSYHEKVKGNHIRRSEGYVMRETGDNTIRGRDGYVMRGI